MSEGSKDRTLLQISSEMTKTLVATDKVVNRSSAQLSALTNLVDQQGRQISVLVKENNDLRQQMQESSAFAKVLDEAVNTRIKDAIAAINSEFNNYKMGMKIEMNNIQANFLKAARAEERKEQQAQPPPVEKKENVPQTPPSELIDYSQFDQRISDLTLNCVKKDELKEAVRMLIRSDEGILGETGAKIHYVAEKLGSIEKKVDICMVEQRKLSLPPSVKRITTGSTPRDGVPPPSSRAATPTSSHPSARPVSATEHRATIAITAAATGPQSARLSMTPPNTNRSKSFAVPTPVIDSSTAKPQTAAKSRPPTGSLPPNVAVLTAHSSAQTSNPVTPAHLPAIQHRHTVDGATATTPTIEKHQDILIRVKTPGAELNPDIDEDFDVLLSSRIRFIESRRLRTVKMSALPRGNVQTGTLPLEEGPNDDASVGNSVQFTNVDDEDLETRLENSELINHRIDAYTIEESDELFERITALEAYSRNLELTIAAQNDKIDEMKFDVDVLTNKVFNDPKVRVKKMWYKLRDDMEFGLGSDEGKESMKAKGAEGEMKDGDEDRLFMEKLREFSNIISVTLPNFDIITCGKPKQYEKGGSNPNSPLAMSRNASANASFNGDAEGDDELSASNRQLLYYTLDELTTEAEVIISRDNDRATGSTLDSIVCQDGSNALKERLINTCRLSYLIIAESIPSITLKRKIDNLERDLSEKSIAISEAHNRCTTLDAEKASKGELAQKADNMELQNLSDLIAVQIAKLGSNDEKDEMMRRLQKHMKDMEANYRATLATKEEVNQVTTKIFGDIRTLKNNTVPIQEYTDMLPTKTDNSDYRKTVAKIYKTISDMQDKGETDIGRMRCIVCDKVADRMSTSGPPVNPSVYASTSQMYYSKPLTAANKANNQQVNPLFPSSTFQRMASKNPSVSNKEKAKVSSDIIILKASVDLPPLNGALLEAMNGGGAAPPSPAHQYKQRIRSAVGGGSSSSMQQDIR